MLTTPTPRPWMPLHYRRYALAHSTLPHPEVPVWRAALLRQAAELKAARPPGALARLRRLFRNPPPIKLRLDELSEQAEAWIADLTLTQNDERTPLETPRDR